MTCHVILLPIHSISPLRKPMEEIILHTTCDEHNRLFRYATLGCLGLLLMIRPIERDERCDGEMIVGIDVVLCEETMDGGEGELRSVDVATTGGMEVFNSRGRMR